jgi:mRNA-degrading endonuclease toxin of MazEF toxin-antitoxin module
VEYERMKIWFAKLPNQEENNGVQQGGRPVIITQNDIGNLHSTTVTVMVGTKRIKNNQPTHVKLDTKCGLKEETVFMAEQQMTINKSQLMFYIGEVPANKVPEVERALKIQAGLMEPFNIGYVREMIDAIMEIDSLYSSETNKIYKIRDIQIKELDRYCSEFGYDYETLLNKNYGRRGVMCG